MVDKIIFVYGGSLFIVFFINMSLDCIEKIEHWGFLNIFEVDIRGDAMMGEYRSGKNWLFSASPKGAVVSAAVYSIVETSKANGLEPFRYLTYLFEKLPNINFKIHPELLEDFLPWSKEVQQNCK